VTCLSSQPLSLPCSRLTPLCCGPETCPVGVKSTNIHLAVDAYKVEAAEVYLLVLSFAPVDDLSVDAEAVVAKVDAATAAATVRARLAAPYQAVAAKKAEAADANLHVVPTTPTCKRRADAD